MLNHRDNMEYENIKSTDNLVIYPAISIVAPHGKNIALGLKTIEVRSWVPDQLPLKNVLLIENHRYLLEDGDEDFGQIVAMVDFDDVHEWREDELEIACGSDWKAGYWAWTISNVRPIQSIEKVAAKRKIYTLSFELGFEF